MNVALIGVTYGNRTRVAAVKDGKSSVIRLMDPSHTVAPTNQRDSSREPFRTPSGTADNVGDKTVGVGFAQQSPLAQQLFLLPDITVGVG